MPSAELRSQEYCAQCRVRVLVARHFFMIRDMGVDGFDYDSLARSRLCSTWIVSIDMQYGLISFYMVFKKPTYSTSS